MSLLNGKNNCCDGVIRDCVGKIGDCPVVTKVEDCYNFIRNEPQIKNFEDVKIEIPECHENDDYKKTLINILDDMIKVLVKYHTELQK
ncbi:MAG: hypothetical protein M0R03_22295 [Novosphingobium sp.]|nr:hypothetical protein [Novosphingobium sp.]